jgi:hypothetical protein
MFGSQVLDTGIGLAMLFALMSLIATALNEAIETILKVRSKQLEQGIRNILSDPDGTSIAKTFFENPLIDILYTGKYDPAKLKSDTLTGREIKEPSSLARSKAMPIGIRGHLPSYIPAANFALAILHIAAAGPPRSAEDIRNSTSLDESPKLKSMVYQALASAQDDLQGAQKYLEEWYDTGMERVSGWYKRRAQYFLFAIGLFAAVVMNVDTITVARSLMSDSSLRQAIIAQAAHIDKSESATLDKTKKDLAEIGLPIGWINTPQLRALQADTSQCTGGRGCIGLAIQNGAVYGSMMLGWLITALAIMLGAPFWFDVLNKFMQLRATTKPATSTASQARIEEKEANSVQSNPQRKSDEGMGAIERANLASLIAIGEEAFEPKDWKNKPDVEGVI